jgi:hypothetical protein
MLYNEYSKQTNVLWCPTDVGRGTPATYADSGVQYPGDNTLRSYIENGFDEVVGVDGNNAGDMKESYLVFPAETVVLSEKSHDQNDYFADFEAAPSDLISKIQYGMHGYTQPSKSGGHNAACGDGGVRYKNFGTDISPFNWWLIFATNRTSAAQTTQLLPQIQP